MQQQADRCLPSSAGLQAHDLRLYPGKVAGEALIEGAATGVWLSRAGSTRRVDPSPGSSSPGLMSQERLSEMQGPRRAMLVGFQQAAYARCDLPGACNDNQRQAPAGLRIAVAAMIGFLEVIALLTQARI
ncbi:hypothetical protein [Methylobacterium nigriterrae]|uniref:hypothetical protein n=1 Tax=Methylobacterium nigriterrae TaxID=3127512 RepID=UPI003013DB19